MTAYVGVLYVIKYDRRLDRAVIFYWPESYVPSSCFVQEARSLGTMGHITWTKSDAKFQEVLGKFLFGSYLQV